MARTTGDTSRAAELGLLEAPRVRRGSGIIVSRCPRHVRSTLKTHRAADIWIDSSVPTADIRVSLDASAAFG